MRKVLFLLAAFLLLFTFAVFFNQGTNMQVKITPDDKSFMDDVKIIHRKSGVFKWSLNAQKAVFVTGSNISLEGVQMYSPDKGLKLVSDKGFYDMDSKNFKISGNIKAAGENYDIVASALVWDSAKNELVSDDKVQIIGKKFHVEGDMFEAKDDKAKLNRNVRAVFNGK
jgi:LPS export ABC transporter protein LptC